MAQSIDSITVQFDWNTLDELESSLQNLEIVGFTNTPIETEHADLLRSSRGRLFATDIAVVNAVELAEGYADLAVLLLEPADIEATSLHSDSLPSTIEYVNNELLRSCRTREWRNTCIIDIRPFRSNFARDLESGNYRDQQDDIAYDVTKRVLDRLSPDVLLLCQSSTRSSSNQFAQSLSSSIGEFGRLSLHRLESGRQVITICGFHPMYAAMSPVGQDPIVARIRRAALQFVFLQAVNILSGKVIRGPGCRKLQDDVYGASREPHMLLSNGTLDPSLDDRFKGIFLAKNAAAEFKQKWQEMMSEKTAEEHEKLHRFVALVSELGSRASSLRTFDELRAALPET